MILATSKIEDFDRFWNAFSTKGAAKRRQHGSKGAHVFRDPNEDDPFHCSEGAVRGPNPNPASRGDHCLELLIRDPRRDRHIRPKPDDPAERRQGQRERPRFRGL